MKIFFFSLFLWFTQGVKSQQLVLQFRQSVPVLPYVLSQGENRSAVEKRFVQLPAEAQPVGKNADTLWLSVSAHLLLAGDADLVMPLQWVTKDGDDFKKIGAALGNIGPYQIKRLNPKIEQPATGDTLLVGYLPKRLFEKSINSTAIAEIKPAPAVAEINPNPPVEIKSGIPVGGLPIASDYYTGSGVYHTEYLADTVVLHRGKAGIFKSMSGWFDGKFYVLINGIKVGTIIKLRNPHNHKEVFAKVAGALPDVKTSSELTLRISNAAAAALDIWSEQAFEIEVQ